MPRTGLRPEEIKDRAVAAAESNIRQHGFEKVRLVDIARDLSVSHVALYKHFPDKAALLDAVSEKWLDQVDAALDEVSHSDAPVLGRIVDWFLTLHRMKVEKVTTDPELYKAFDMAAEVLKPFVLDHLRNMHATLVGMCAEAMREGVITLGDSEQTANLLMETTQGFHHPKMVLEHLATDRVPALEATLKLVFRGLGAQD